MLIKFLGTGASEGIPSMHCKCKVCKNARMIKGKEIRSRMGILIDGELMIDLSPDAFFNALRYEIDCSKIKHLLITHSHSDHFHIDDVVPNILVEQNEHFEPLNVYSNDKVLNCLKMIGQNNMRLHEIQYESTVEVNDFKITAFPAVHILDEKCMTFVIEKNGKCYLHLVDTGVIGDALLTWLKEHKLTVDVAAIDTTFGLLETEYFGHMNSNQVIRISEKFREAGIFTKETQVYMTHICHWGGTHEELQRKARRYGIEVAYDGLEVDV